MRTIGIIPARMASSRFPGKPMFPICGVPMIGHVYLRTSFSRNLDDLYVATCDREIYNYIISIGGKAVMTKDTHTRATERVGEAIEKIISTGVQKPDVTIMVQGDEPLMRPEIIDLMIQELKNKPVIDVLNLVNNITDDKEYLSKDIVKLIYGKDKRAIWFFRQPSPFWQDKVKELPIKIQTGIIAFKTDVLNLFNSMPPTPFEKANSVDMCRFIENDLPVFTVDSPFRLYSVDTPADQKFVEGKMIFDELYVTYK